MFEEKGGRSGGIRKETLQTYERLTNLQQLNLSPPNLRAISQLLHLALLPVDQMDGLEVDFEDETSLQTPSVQPPDYFVDNPNNDPSVLKVKRGIIRTV